MSQHSTSSSDQKKKKKKNMSTTVNTKVTSNPPDSTAMTGDAIIHDQKQVPDDEPNLVQRKKAIFEPKSEPEESPPTPFFEADTFTADMIRGKKPLVHGLLM